MSLWTSIESELASLVKQGEAELKAVATYFKPVAQASATEIAGAAFNAVVAQAPAVISGQEKLNAAASSIVTTLGADGKQILMSDALAAAQTAYNEISKSVTAPQT